jgi:hypothetical protein
MTAAHSNTLFLPFQKLQAMNRKTNQSPHAVPYQSFSGTATTNPIGIPSQTPGQVPGDQQDAESLTKLDD